MSARDPVDVVVAGGGNAGLCAALSARGEGASVLVLEKAPEEWRGGNSFFTAGAFRCAFTGVDDIRTLVPDMSAEELAAVDIEPYPESRFFDDLARVTEDLTDPDLAMTLVQQSFSTMQWLRSQGVRWILMFGRQAFKVGGRFRFWGGVVVEVVGGGPGLIEALYERARKTQVEVRFESKATRLVQDDAGRVVGVEVRHGASRYTVEAGAVVLASGGFEANAEWRARYLGKDWDLAKVRGTPFNTGDGIRMALEVGAQPFGHWTSCHAVAWDANAPPHGDRKVGDNFQKHSYPLGIVVNTRGERFLDEGADFRNYTYAEYGRRLITQPRRAAFQIFDAKVLDMLREEYRIREVTRAEASSIAELARKLEIDADGLVRTVQAFNASISAAAFDPTKLDGKTTVGVTPPKSNWAQPLDTPPFVGYAVTTGITFTFGGLRVRPDGQVLDTESQPLPGLYGAGELVGGLFYHNYPGGSGLMAGAVFGRIAGRSAAHHARGRA